MTEYQLAVDQAFLEYHELDQLIRQLVRQEISEEGIQMKWESFQTENEAAEAKGKEEQKGNVCTDPYEVLLGNPPQKLWIVVTFTKEDLDSPWGHFNFQEGENS